MLLNLPEDIICNHIIPLNLYITVALHKTCKWLYNISNKINGINIKEYFLHEIEDIVCTSYVNKMSSKRDGICIIYYNTSLWLTNYRYMMKKCWYIDGQKNGNVYMYRIDGSIYKTKTYINGQKNGNVCYYGVHGNIDRIRTYVNNRKHGIEKIIISKNRYMTTNYENGYKSGLCQEFNNGVKIKECKYVNDQLYGNYREWDFNGLRTKHLQYKNGKKHGSCIKWDRFTLFEDNEDRKEYNITTIIKECTYKEDKKDGKYIRYRVYEDNITIKVRECTYKKGKLHGELITYKDNVIYSIENYIDGIRHGNQTFYKKDGRINKVIKYKYGKMKKGTCILM
ncbi:MORN-repeat protein [Orpheovirus IHUMI-LCC2]|uniref:MORN-repeat protein n=1 Tax=Orpheovirus IHUMI-LCC2 TaxID=2023057 RepID=A0A2I2L552_9VIRU|nr:MORN-repeat protein [Orpheovirus IHUMI-LCC2]SNW62663.1 MORN-repeat protein [Orpheovirus IHUMI-LCC2]